MLEGALLVMLGFFSPVLLGDILTVFTTGLVGGRMAAISLGLEFGFQPLAIVILLSVFNSTWLFVFYPLITVVFEYVVEVKLLGSMISKTKRIAEFQKKRIEKYGLIGLFVFVWLPFPWTGSLVGALVGKLSGLSTRKVLMIVMPAMYVSIFSWTIIFKDMFQFLGKFDARISTGVVAAIVIYSLSVRVYKVRKSRINGK